MKYRSLTTGLVLFACTAYSVADVHQYGVALTNSNYSAFGFDGKYNSVSYVDGGTSVTQIASGHISAPYIGNGANSGWQERFPMSNDEYFAYYFTLNAGDAPQLLMKGLGESLGLPDYTLSGSVIGADYTKSVYNVSSFRNAFISEVDFPPLNSTSSSSASVLLKLQPSEVALSSLSSAPPIAGTSSTTGNWSEKNYKVTIGGTDYTKYITKVAGESITVGTTIDSPLSRVKDPSNIVLTFASPSVTPNLPTYPGPITITYYDTLGTMIGTLVLSSPTSAVNPGVIYRGNLPDRIDYTGSTPRELVFSAGRVAWL